MDVTCERCGTEYEFDETLVSDRGTTVKCTNCGHLFKVFRPDSDQGAKTWSVRSADGKVRTLSSLKELQRLITEGVLRESDGIARGNEPWKRLGDIAELSTFFAAAGVATADTEADAPRRQRRGTTPGMHAAPSEERAITQSAEADATIPEPPRPPPGAPPPSAPKKSTIMGMGARSPSDAPSAGPPSPPPRPPPRPPRPMAPPAPERPISEPPSADVTANARATRPGGRPPLSQPSPPPTRSSPPSQPYPSQPAAIASSQAAQPVRAPAAGPLYLDEHEPVAPPRGRSRSALWVGLVVLLASGVAVALAWPQIAPLVGLAQQPENPANPHNEAGDAALAQDTIEGYEQALHHYTQALAYAEHDVGVLTRLARTEALWAQALAFDADDLEAQAEGDPARIGEANAIRREVRRHAETALENAEDAVRHGSGDAGAEVALADALRLTGDLSRSRSRLERALTLESQPSAETLRVEAMVEIAEANGDVSRGADHAEAAVAEDPSLIRARLLTARALLAAHDVSGARRQLDAILQRVPRHPRAMALREAIEQGRPPAPPTVDVPDGGVAEAVVAPTQPDTTPETTPDTAPDTAPDTTPDTTSGGGHSEGGDTGGAVPRGRDYSWYIRAGDERLERGDVARARAFYEAAQSVRPSGSEALTGLGYTLLEQGNASGAADKFRQAAGQGYAEAYIGLGTAYRQLGRNQDALTAYERYLERLPSGPRASIARRQVEELRRLTGAGEAGGGATGGGGGTGGGASGAGDTGGGAGDTGGTGGGEPAPPTPEGTLPPPRDMEGPAPADTPALEGTD